MKIAVVGLGYVGLVNSILLVQHHDVVVLDIDPKKITMHHEKISPIKDEEIAHYLCTKKLRFEAIIIEKYGSGIQKIKNECQTHGVIAPIFEEFVHGFRVILHKEKINGWMNEAVKLLYELIKIRPNKRSTYFAKELKPSTKNIERWFKQLKDEGKIAFVGSPKTGEYFEK